MPRNGSHVIDGGRTVATATTTDLALPPQRLETIGQARTWYPYVWAVAAGPRPSATNVLGDGYEGDLLWALPHGPSVAVTSPKVLDEMQRPRALAVRVAGWPLEVWKPIYGPVSLAPDALNPAGQPDPNAGRSVAVTDDPTEGGRATQPATMAGWLATAYPLLAADAIADALGPYADAGPSNERRRLNREAMDTRAWCNDRMPVLRALSRPWWDEWRSVVSQELNKRPNLAPTPARRTAVARLR
jgi:hypothetical protein